MNEVMQMLEADDDVMNEFMQMLEATPDTGPASNDIPAKREKLAILVSTGKAKEVIGVQLTHEQVKRLSDKDVEKYNKRHEAYIGSKTTESLIDSFLMLVSKGLGMVVKIGRCREAAARPQERLHHQPRALLPCRGYCFELRALVGPGQCSSHYDQTRPT